jgi:predicted transcriptional regulator
MTRIVHPHFPVEKLPEELKRALGDVSHVRLTVEDTVSQDKMREKINAAIDMGLADVAAGRVSSVEDVQARMEKRFPLDPARDSAA